MLKQDDKGNEIVRVEVWVGEKPKGNPGPSQPSTTEGIYVDRPTITGSDGSSVLMTPQHARLRNLTYATKLYADITVVYYINGSREPLEVKSFPYTILGRIPIMLHSDQCVLHNQGSKVLRSLGECPMDPGGYFIIEGKEKVIVSQERVVTNRLFVQSLEDDDYFSHKAYIHCTGTGETALSPRSVEFVIVKPKRVDLDLGGGTQDTTGKDKSDKSDEKDEDADNNDTLPGGAETYRKIPGAILVSLPSIKGRLPLSTVFRLFGITSDKGIVEAICGSSSIPQLYQDFLRPSLAHSGPINAKGIMTPIYTQRDAYQNVKDRVHFKSIDHLKTIIFTDIFPNVEGGNTEKAKYLAYLISTFMKTVIGILPQTDRDGFVFKRIDVSGYLLSQLFQETYIKFRNSVRDKIDQEYHFKWRDTDLREVSGMIRQRNLHIIFSQDIITDTLQKSLKGMWGPPVSDPELHIVQDLARISYVGTLSHLRRVNINLDRSLKITAPHRLHSQQWGIMCPFETPDGASVGYLKNFALLTQVAAGAPVSAIIKALLVINKTKIALALPSIMLSSASSIKVFINGNLYGVTDDPVYLTKAFRLFRRNGLISPHVSISWNIRENEIRINTDAGRPLRPLLIVDKQKVVLHERYKTLKKITWDELVTGKLVKDGLEPEILDSGFISPFSLSIFDDKPLDAVLKHLETTQGCIEYLDIEEENTMLLAMKNSDISSSELYTHLEIHPSTTMSVVTNVVPFANHNQAPRVYFHGSQSKQATGIYATNWHERFDTSGYILHYPQKGLVSTRGAHYNGVNIMGNGTNVIVAIMTYQGFNQEDSVMINRAAIERGLFHVSVYKTVSASEKAPSATERVMFANPLKLQKEKDVVVHGIKHANYDVINDEGIAREESYIPRGQDAVVIGMVQATEMMYQERKGVFMDNVKKTVYRDVSLKTDVNHYGTIDRVFVGTTVPGNKERICKVRFRKVRKPELGDKMCSRHGQKGVVGMILEEEDMPFTKDGIRPDIIINPHAFPSRMTMGHLLETVFAKLCCMEGCIGDGTVFIPFDKEGCFDKLNTHGFDRHGNEVLYNGRNGSQIQTDIFVGPILYYRLKHMVVDKVQSRGTEFIHESQAILNGPRVQLTRQPTSGRSAGGGLRVGEMERDVLIGHGMAQFTRESYMEKADAFKWYICRHCGVPAVYNLAKNIAKCPNCASGNLAFIETPFAMKLFIQELEAMGIEMRLSVDPIPDSYIDKYEYNDHTLDWQADGGAEDPNKAATDEEDEVEDVEGDVDVEVEKSLEPKDPDPDPDPDADEELEPVLQEPKDPDADADPDPDADANMAENADDGHDPSSILTDLTDPSEKGPKEDTIEPDKLQKEKTNNDQAQQPTAQQNAQAYNPVVGVSASVGNKDQTAEANSSAVTSGGSSDVKLIEIDFNKRSIPEPKSGGYADDEEEVDDDDFFA